MPKDEVPDAASLARAERLRKQIEEMKSGGPKEPPQASEKDSPKSQSPRDFIQQRMRELDRKA